MANLNINTTNALASLRALIQEVNDLKNQLQTIKGTNSDAFKKISKSSDDLRSKIGLLGNRINYLQAIITKQNAAIQKNTNATNKNSVAKNKNKNSANENAKANKKLNLSFKSLISSFGLIGGINLFRNILKETYETIKTFDSLSFALERVTETTQNYESSQRFLLQLTRDYGVELVSTTNRWIKFLAAAKNAGLSLFDTEKIFRSMTKAASVLGLKTDELQGIYLALEQMLSKGKVSTEELRRQLGERLPGAMGIMAASIGVTLPKLDEMLRKGEVLSAEVLPNFADAVEVAFGIDTVDKVRTLVAEQNRLTAAFQIFVKNISEGDSVIKKGLEAILRSLTEFIDAVNWIFSTEDQRLRERISKRFEVERKGLEESFRRTLDMQRSNDQKTFLAKQKITKILKQLDSESNSERRKQLKAQLDELQRIIVTNNNEAVLAQKKHARENIGLAKAELDRINDLRSKGKAAADAAEERDFGRFNDFQKSIRKTAIEEVRRAAFIKATGKEVNVLSQEYVVLAARYDLYRKLIDESEVVVPDKKGDNTRVKRLQDILDLEKQIQIEVAKTSIANNESSIKSYKTGFDEKIKLSQANSVLLNRIAQLQFEIEEDKLKISLNKKNNSLNDALAKGTKIIGDVNQHRLDLQKEHDQKIIIAQEKRDAKIISNNEASSSKTMKIIDDVNKFRLKRVQDPYSKEIIAIKENFDISAKTAEDKKKLEKELRRVAIESANAQIDAQISLLRAQLTVKDQHIDTINAIIFKINELEAQKKRITPENIQDSKFWFDILDLAKEYNQAIGDLVDAGFNRRIENINAEIEAEKSKYDKLIALAEGDAEQQKTLERNKQEAIDQLEAKRLRQEQKQARSRKAFAVADIAISTAQAIMKAYAQTGPIGGAVLAALVGALGAVQVAAVLSQPIPQYKDGGNITKDEIAMINDGGVQEYVERGNTVLTTDTKNAIVGLKAGDTVHKNYDSLVNKSSLITKGGVNQLPKSEINFNKMYFGVRNAVKDGLKEAKIDNKVNVINKMKSVDNSYRDELNRWNK